MDAEDLDAFRATWLRDRDGSSGRRYAEALVAVGREDDALAVCAAMWDDGFAAGRTDAAWIEHDRGRVDKAIGLMTGALDVVDDEDLPLALGILGHWRWLHRNDLDAEALLRAGMDAYPTARADLADLLSATGRTDESRRLLEEGVEGGVVLCMLPLANRLDEDGETDAAIALYAQAFDAGDGYAAWNLALVLERIGLDEEAEAWRWRAAQAGDELAVRSLLIEDEPEER